MNTDTQWFRQAKWGVFCHYLGGYTPEEWNAQVDAFDVDGLVEQLKAVNPGYFFLTVGQNTGFYCAPNAVYEGYAGCGLNARCSRRDLPLEIGEKLRKHGIRLMLYINGVAPHADEAAAKGLGCEALAYADPVHGPENNGWCDWGVTPLFNQRWCEVYAEWAKRYGDLVSGWWVDGCYKHVGFKEEHVAAYKRAFRTGNPAAICAFNGGVRTPVHAWFEADDYTAGEIDSNFPVGRTLYSQDKIAFLKPGDADGAQFHILTYLGQAWAHPTPRLPDAFVKAYTRYLADTGGVISWDCAIEKSGHLSADSFKQLQGLLDIRGGPGGSQHKRRNQQ